MGALAIDSFILFTPLLLMVLLVPFVFVGCGEYLGPYDYEGFSAPTGASLLFDRALQVLHDPLPAGSTHVTQLQVHTIIVHWKLTGADPPSNPLSVQTTQSKGSAAEPLNTREAPFWLNVESLSYTSEIQTIHCQCEVKLRPADEVVTTKEVSVQYRKNMPHYFRLRRTPNIEPFPGITVKQVAFTVTLETEKN